MRMNSIKSYLHITQLSDDIPEYAAYADSTSDGNSDFYFPASNHYL